MPLLIKKWVWWQHGWSPFFVKNGTKWNKNIVIVILFLSNRISDLFVVLLFVLPYFLLEIKNVFKNLIWINWSAGAAAFSSYLLKRPPRKKHGVVCYGKGFGKMHDLDWIEEKSKRHGLTVGAKGLWCSVYWIELLLDDARIDGMIEGLKQVASLPDPNR